MVVTIMVGIGIGWAKPTPVNPLNLRGGRFSEAMVAAAGPLSNFALASVAAIPLRYIDLVDLAVPAIVVSTLYLFVAINILLMVFNLLPIPPLDGSKVLFAFMSPQTAWRWRPVLEQYGFLILIVAVFLPFGPGGGTLFSLVVDSVIFPLVGLLTGIER
jgi:Zn-dependent protease